MKCRNCTTAQLEPIRIGKTALIHCQSCDISYLADMPEEKQQADYYEQNYQLSLSSRGLTEMRRMSRWSENVKLIQLLLATSSPHARLLDVGCDKGYFLDEARRWGMDVFGMEPSAEGREYASRIGLHVAKDLSEYQGQHFDVISLWHVLEHINNPLSFLKQLQSMMDADAHIHIRVPNFASLSSRILRSRWIWFQPRNHLFHYSKSSLQTLLQTAGFEVDFVRSQRPNSVLTLLEFLTTNLSLWRSGAATSSLRSWGSTLMQFLSGVELYAVARVKQ